jgi:hypothetical protein
MALETALFTTSNNDLQYYPRTPFQILYVNADEVEVIESEGGVTVIGQNEFDAKPWNFFYVPIFNIDDSPPVIGDFPERPRQAERYLFGKSSVGADLSIEVDGALVRGLHEYLVGPIDTPPLLDGGGTHILTVGAFIGPLRPGIHTVRLRGRADGTVFQEASGLAFLAQDFTYTIHVQRR